MVALCCSGGLGGLPFLKPFTKRGPQGQTPNPKPATEGKRPLMRARGLVRTDSTCERVRMSFPLVRRPSYVSPCLALFRCRKSQLKGTHLHHAGRFPPLICRFWRCASGDPPTERVLVVNAHASYRTRDKLPPFHTAVESGEAPSDTRDNVPSISTGIWSSPYTVANQHPADSKQVRKEIAQASREEETRRRYWRS